MKNPARRPGPVAIVLAATAVILLAVATTAHAAPPANDNFANATVLPGPLPQQLAGTNVEATKEVGEPEPTFTAGGASVWYRWTAPGNAHVTVDTCAEPPLDTVLVVYTGAAVNALTEVSGNDDACGDGLQSRTSFDATQGTTYNIAVEGFAGATGKFALHLEGSVHAFTISSSIGAGDPLQTGRLFRNGASSSCDKPNVVPIFDKEPHHFKSFAVESLINEPYCLALTNDADSACKAAAQQVQAAAYHGPFNPLDPTAGLISAAGSSAPPATSFSASFAAGETALLIVNEVAIAGTGLGCPAFTLAANSDRPWATARPRVLSGGADATGKTVVSEKTLSAGAAAWSSSVTHAYQWQSCDKAGNGCTSIAGATGEKFKPRFAQVGHALRVIDSATDSTVGTTASSTSGATAPVKPSNVIRFGKFKRNKSKGTGVLTVIVPGPGKLTLTGKGVKKATGKAKGPGKAKLKVRPKGKAEETLDETGKARVRIKVKFKPSGNSAGSKGRTLVLKES